MLDLNAARDAAERAATAAAEVIAAHLARDDWQVSYKADDSPVTEVDVAAEHAIRAVLQQALPEAILDGEELGNGTDDAGAQGSGLVWRIDPIDGTKSFVRRMPFYSTQIALERDGELVVGVSNAPAYGAHACERADGQASGQASGQVGGVGIGERLVAVRGQGATLNGRTVRTGEVTSIDQAFLSSGNLASLARDEAAWSRYGRLVARVRRTRGYGDFAHYHQLCAGHCDLVIESDVNILDIAALTVAVRESGGTITDLAGRPIGPDTRSVLAACTAALHAEAFEILAWQGG